MHVTMASRSPSNKRNDRASSRNAGVSTTVCTIQYTPMEYTGLAAGPSLSIQPTPRFGAQCGEELIVRNANPALMARPGNEAAPNELIEQITVDAHGEDEQLWAFRQAFEDGVTVPSDAFVIGEAVSVLKFDYDGNDRFGYHQNAS